MLIAGAPRSVRKAGERIVHIAGEDEQVDLADQLQRPPLGLDPRLAGDGHVVKRDPDRLDLVAQLVVIGDDADDLPAEVPVAPAPEEVGEAMVVARDHHRDPLGPCRLVEGVLHLIGRRDLPREPLRQRLPIGGGR